MKLGEFKKQIAKISRIHDELEVVVYVEEAERFEPVLTTHIRIAERQLQICTLYDMTVK
jgi:hypothetical protein